MLPKSTWLAFLLACGAVAVPDGKAVLGYRTVDPKEAVAINKAGAPVWDGVSNRSARQIGAGIYTSPGPGDWKGKAGDWYCVIYADKDRLDGDDSVAKIWIPNWYYKPDGTKIGLWDLTNSAALTTYIEEYKGNNWKATTTLRMSNIRWVMNKVQLVIPPGLVAESGGLGLSAVCTEKMEDLPDKERVDYSAWQNNIGGDREPPPKPEPETSPAPPPKTKALSIIFQNYIDPIGNTNTWLFLETDIGVSKLCTDEKEAIHKVDAGGGPGTVDNPPWPGGSFPLTLDGLGDCEYKNDGTNTGSLWCSGNEIKCQEDSMKAQSGSETCELGDIAISQHPVVFCEW
ncbi:hypothetical protein J1614_000003 [Plenodomus biglobosus]|nr:hypothetical protein J1614_000003 [Plenodomus biglobosus]